MSGAESRCSELRNIIAFIVRKVVGVNKEVLYMEMLCLNMELSKDKERPVTTTEVAPVLVTL